MEVVPELQRMAAAGDVVVLVDSSQYPFRLWLQARLMPLLLATEGPGALAAVTGAPEETRHSIPRPLSQQVAPVVWPGIAQYLELPLVLQEQMVQVMGAVMERLAP